MWMEVTPVAQKVAAAVHNGPLDLAQILLGGLILFKPLQGCLADHAVGQSVGAQVKLAAFNVGIPADADALQRRRIGNADVAAGADDEDGVGAGDPVQVIFVRKGLLAAEQVLVPAPSP